MNLTRRDRLPLFLRRTLLMGFALALALAMGLRVPPTQASAWSSASFAGQARLAVTIHDTMRPEGVPAIGPYDVYTGAPFGTGASSFARGLVIRASFTLPGESTLRVLALDLDRRGERDRWEVTDARHAEIRYYVQDPATGRMIFDGRPVGGTIALEEVVIASGVAGFRLSGWVEVGEAGQDGAFDTGDDLLTELSIVVETVPSPEEISRRATRGTLPDAGVCDAPSCYAAPSYYAYDPYGDTVIYDMGCGGSTDVYEEDPSGCEGDTYDEPDPYWGDGGGTYADDSSYDDDGCGTNADNGGCGGDGASGDGSGCDSGTSSSSSSSSGCGGNSGGGCTGDTYDP